MATKSTIYRLEPDPEGQLRTAIPKELYEELALSAGDVLEWSIEGREGKKRLIVRKLE